MLFRILRLLFGPRPRPEVEQARAWLASSPVIFDTETTGFGKKDQIVEIACLSEKGDVLFQSLVRPSCPVSDGARRIHRISDAALADAPTIAEIMPDLRRVFDGRMPITYNFDFDRRMLMQTLAVAELDWPEAWDHWGQPAEHYCIMLLYAQFYGDERWDGEYVWQKLVAALQQCGIRSETNSHRAVDDARAALAVLQHMARS